MAKRVSLAVLLAICALVPSRAFAGFDSGNDLYKFCNNTQNTFEQGMCYGAISGYFDSMKVAFSCKRSEDNVTRKQVVDIVMKHLRENPSTRNYPAAIISMAAFKEAFDCKSWVGDGPVGAESK
jgi:hypothetical protein